MASIPKQRLEKRIQTLTSQVLLRDMKDPRLGFLTVTRAELSKDLREAKVFVSVLGTPAQQRTALRALDDARPYVQQTIGKSLAVRMIPRLTFVFDESIDKDLRLAEIFRGIEKERAGPPEAPTGGEPDPDDDE